MNVLFMTIGGLPKIESSDIYADLLRTFRDHGHQVYAMFPFQRKMSQETKYYQESGINMLGVKIGNITKCSMLEKGISTLLVEREYKTAIKKYFSNIRFDLIIYTTPPITLAGAVKYIRTRDKGTTYLLLKDIFPQNAVDLGMMRKTGPKGLLYKMFRRKEKQLYAVSDYIGCMSPANVEFVLKNNPEISADRVEVCPNCIEPLDMSVTREEHIAMRRKYGIPQDKIVFVYGGNLGKPQGVPFLIDCIRSQKNNPNVFFLIVGSGTEYGKLDKFQNDEHQENFKLLSALPKDDYDRMAASCDVGMIFLDHRFTIPNFPSRLLAYMQAKLPVLCCTDPNTDIGKIAEDNGFGWWCESNSVDDFLECISRIFSADLAQMGSCGYRYLKEHYTVTEAYKIIMESVNG